MDFLSTQCAAQSAGPANVLINLLIQSLISSYCDISTPDKWPKDYGTEALENGLEDFDFVVIGSGSAGSVVASRLAENPQNKVLLLEAGGDPPIESEIPLWFFLIQHSQHDWQYYVEPNKRSCQGMKTQTCYWPRGKTLGGSGAINAMVSIRGHRRDFDKWRDAGNPTWGYDDLLEYFKKSENTHIHDGFVNETERGQDGFQIISKPAVLTNSLDEMLINAASEFGYKYKNDFTDSHGYTGFFRAYSTSHNGRRISTAKSFLLPASKKPNLRVIKYAHVEKINFDDKKNVESVSFVYKSLHKMKVNVKKEAILSAGAIGTPQILQLSGIGLEKDLNKFSIPVLQPLSVGRNLQDHVIVPLYFKLHTTTGKPHDKRSTLDDLYNYLSGKTSYLSQIGVTGLCGFINTENKKNAYPDIEYHYFFFKKNDELGVRTTHNIIGYNDEIIDSLIKANHEADILVAWTVLLNPESKGKVVIRSDQYDDKPKIYSNYFDKENDVDLMIKGIKFHANLVNTKSFKENEAELIKPNVPACNKFDFQSEDFWKCYIKFMSTTVYHPVGTAKMGPKSDKKAVVDPELKVHGIKGLRVCDASIMPYLISANTNAATIMIGEKCSDFIKDTWHEKSSQKDEF